MLARREFGNVNGKAGALGSFDQTGLAPGVRGVWIFGGDCEDDLKLRSVSVNWNAHRTGFGEEHYAEGSVCFSTSVWIKRIEPLGRLRRWQEVATAPKGKRQDGAEKQAQISSHQGGMSRNRRLLVLQLESKR